MNKLIIASHSTLSEGLLKSAELIIGETKNVRCITAYVDESVDYEKMIANVVENFDYENGKLIVATDLVGGSVNNEFVKHMDKYPFHLISGVNLVTIISIILKLENITETDLKQIAEEAKETVVYFDKSNLTTTDDF